jgi:hypothetical protein
MKLTKQHKIAIVITIIMIGILYFVNFMRNGTSW